MNHLPEPKWTRWGSTHSVTFSIAWCEGEGARASDDGGGDIWAVVCLVEEVKRYQPVHGA
jgi:hypothetical protein